MTVPAASLLQDSKDELEIRDAQPEDDQAVAVFLYNNFRHSWNHQWFFRSKTIPDEIPFPPPRKLKSSNRNRLDFYVALVAAVRLSKGLIRIMRPRSSQMIVGAAMWSLPGSRILDNPTDILNSGFATLMLPWKLGYHTKTRIEQFEALVKSMQKAAFKAHTRSKLRPIDCLYLQIIAVDPSMRGRGLAGRLVQDGLMRVGPTTPVLLETSSDRLAAIYARLGFEKLAEQWIAKGECDEDGCRGQGKPMVHNGGPVIVMADFRNVTVP
ncbi:hypothetical protein OIV83_000515 [Microbotryomycetes sp. JL201]|nr:hypothetical protein OIV83_000515 [Microbotryomycetes sp. JL201]